MFVRSKSRKAALNWWNLIVDRMVKGYVITTLSNTRATSTDFDFLEVIIDADSDNHYSVLPRMVF